LGIEDSLLGVFEPERFRQESVQRPFSPTVAGHGHDGKIGPELGQNLPARPAGGHGFGSIRYQEKPFPKPVSSGDGCSHGVPLCTEG
jgi:hypothetical protein